jgi:hypothetical protein
LLSVRRRLKYRCTQPEDDMTTLPADIEAELLHLEISAVRHQFVQDCRTLIHHLTVSEVLELVALAYRTLPAGSVMGLRGKEVAEEVEVAGEFLAEKYGV